MNRSIVQLANSKSAIDAIRQGLIACGFELEFQRLNGNSASDCSGETDWDALSDASNDAWNHELAISEKITEVKEIDEDVGSLLEALYELCNRERRLYRLPDLIADPDLRRRINDTIDGAETAWREQWEEDNSDSYQTSGDIYDQLEASRSTRSIIKLGTDQSVDGGEIRTIGGLRPMAFLRAATDLLDHNDFEVDTGCSFHIHLSVPGVKHFYGKDMQANMLAYLLDHKDRLPESMLDRLKSHKLDHFAALQLSTEKFSAVHCHPQGTWEFRLFGNINQACDARRCLLLAIEALRYAYRVKLGLEKSLVCPALLESFNAAAIKARQNSENFRSVAKNIRAESY